MESVFGVMDNTSRYTLRCGPGCDPASSRSMCTHPIPDPGTLVFSMKTFANGAWTRSVFSLLPMLALSLTTVNAQQGGDALLLSIDHPLDHMTTKMVYEVVQDFDPNGKVSMALDHIELRIAAEVSAIEMMDALNAIGTAHFAKFNTGRPMERMVSGPLFDDFPRYTDTGDPEADEAAFAAAKQAWLSVHPEYYNRPLPKQVR